MNSRTAILIASLLFCAVHAPAQSILRHSEIAAKNALFADVGLSPLIFDEFKFQVLPLEPRFDYMLPLPLPFSAGLFLKTPNPNLKSFGTRLAYHFDLNMPQIDLYFVYVFDYGFIRNDVLKKYDDTPVEPHFYDFRIGVRYFFASMIGLAVETDFKVGGLVFALSIKII